MNIKDKDLDFLIKMAKWKEWKNDPLLFAEECVMVPAAGGNQLVKLYEPQKRVLKSFYKNNFLVLLKSRQVGQSFLSQVIAAHLVIFYDNVKIGILSRSGDEASDFAKKIKDIIKEIPYEWARPKKFSKDTARSFELPNGSAVYTGAVSMTNPASVFRGKSLTVLFVDEAAFIPKVDIAWTAVAPSLSKTQKVAKENGTPYGCIILSTPNKTTGIGEWYYKRWVQALSENGGDGVWTPHKIHWKEIPDFANDPDWFNKQCELLENNPSKIAQELNLEFIGSEDAIFDVKTQRLLNQITSDKSKLKEIPFSQGGKLWIFGDYDPKKFYIIGVDTASNSGEDYSTIEVLDYKTCEQVMEYRGKLEPKKFAEVLKTIAKMIPRNVIAIENSGGYGITVLNELQFDTLQEYNLYGEFRNEKTKKFVAGLNTNKRTRPMIIESMFNTVVNNPSTIKSENLAMELLALTNKNGKVEADLGFHDDLVMAFAFACYVRAYGVDRYAGFLHAEAEDNSIIYDALPVSRVNKSSEFVISADNFVERFAYDVNTDFSNPADNYAEKIMKQHIRDKYNRNLTEKNKPESLDDSLEMEMFNSDIFE